MSPPRTLAVGAGVLTIGVLASGCGSTSHETRSPAEAIPSALRALATASSRFAKVMVPGAVCGSRRPIELRYGEGTAGDAGRRIRFVDVVDEVVYGRLGSDGGQAAGLKLMCSKPYTERPAGDDGQVGFTWVIFIASATGRKAVSVVMPQELRAPRAHLSLLGRVTIRPRRIIVPEYWYRPGDRACCPSGRATTVWRYVSGALRPQTTVVERRSSQKPQRVDLNGINWFDVALPGSVCGATRPIQLRGGIAFPAQTRWGRQWRRRVHWPAWPRVTVYARANSLAYGDLDGDGQNEAALGVHCAISRGTASSVLAYAQVIFTAARNSPKAIAIVTPRSPDRYGEPAVDVHIEPGRILAHEHWYGPNDGTCCPTGRSTTFWQYRNGTLSPVKTVIERRPKR